MIAYDIADDKRRGRIHKALKNRGTWVQHSVFQCRLNMVQWLLLQHQLQALMKADEDSVRVYRLCKRCRPKVERIGCDKPLEGPTVIV